MVFYEIIQITLIIVLIHRHRPPRPVYIKLIHIIIPVKDGHQLSPIIKIILFGKQSFPRQAVGDPGQQNYHRVDGENGMVERTGKVMEIIA